MRAASREQIEFRACCWNDLLPDDHPARIVWQYVLGLDLSHLLDRVKAALAGRKKKGKKKKRGGQPGHPKHERPAFQPDQIQ